MGYFLKKSAPVDLKIYIIYCIYIAYCIIVTIYLLYRYHCILKPKVLTKEKYILKLKEIGYTQKNPEISLFDDIILTLKGIRNSNGNSKKDDYIKTLSEKSNCY